MFSLFTWFFSRFLPQSKNMYVRLIGINWLISNPHWPSLSRHEGKKNLDLFLNFCIYFCKSSVYKLLKAYVREQSILVLSEQKAYIEQVIKN